jgi:hypothetical protein
MPNQVLFGCEHELDALTKHKHAPCAPWKRLINMHLLFIAHGLIHGQLPDTSKTQ